MRSQYWLYKWLDYYHIQNINAARILLTNPVAVEELRMLASNSRTTQVKPELETNQETILAGRGIDLSGRLDCNHPDCRRKQIDQLFRRVWHYFDRIIVEDAVTHEVSVHWDEGSPRVREWILSHISVLLQLRELDVEDLVEFREKPPACEVHFQKHAEDAGLGHIADSLENETNALEAKAVFGISEKRNGSVVVRIDHPLFEHTQWETLERGQIKGLSRAAIKRMALTAVLKMFIAHLTADVSAAQKYGVPLGAVVGIHRHLLEQSSRIGAADIAFRLSLPVLNGVSAKTLASIRKQEREHFVRFQQGLKKAITERLKTAGSERAEALAREIEQDLIQTNLNLIRDRLAASEKTLLRKASVGVFLGGLTTTCGLLCGVLPPAALSAGAGAAIVATGAASAKYLDDRQETELNDMYFAWKAVQHAPHKSTEDE
jgi:hypothetical protein